MVHVSDEILDWIDDYAPAGRGDVVMMKVYLDRGLKRDKTDGVVTVAAVVFKATGYKRFVRPWNRMLREWGADAFHATDFYPGGGDFKRLSDVEKERFNRHCLEVPEMISGNVTRMIAVGFRPDEFNALASDAFKNHYGKSLHSIAVQFCLITNGWLAQGAKYHEGFSCVMESGDEDEVLAVDTVAKMKRDPITAKHIQVRSFGTADKGTARGLEAADCLAWHWNKYYMDKFRHGDEQQLRRDFAKMMKVAEGKTYVSLVVGWKLKEFLSLSVLPDGASPLAQAGVSWPIELS